jgi:proteic killer suppression protein
MTVLLAVLRTPQYHARMIRSFRCKGAQASFEGGHSKRFRAIKTIATRKPAMPDAAKNLRIMRPPPGNRLEPLEGDRAGQWSVRINDQWRLCFVWTDLGPGRACADRNGCR